MCVCVCVCVCVEGRREVVDLPVAMRETAMSYKGSAAQCARNGF